MILVKTEALKRALPLGQRDRDGDRDRDKVGSGPKAGHVFSGCPERSSACS